MTVADTSTATREEKVLRIIETARGKQAKFRDEHVTMSHGAGGKATQSMIEGLFLPAFGGETLAAMGDAGAVADGLVMTTDSFVVKPIRFPGGSIGELAVNGTVNDLAMAGARPLALSLSLILEEGLPSGELRAEVEAIAAAAAIASTSARRSSAERPSSSTSESVSASGRAPAIARSFTVPFTASSPIEPPGKRIGLTTKLSVVSASPSNPAAATTPASPSSCSAAPPKAGRKRPVTSVCVALPPAPCAIVI